MDKNCNFIKLCYAKALSSLKNSDVTNAIPELNRCLKMDGENVDALNLIGFCHYMLCEFESAKGFWRKSLHIKKNDNKASVYMDIVESTEFRRIIGQYEKAKNLFDQGDYKNAAFKMLNIISEKKELVKPYMIAGVSIAKMGDVQEGISYMEKALEKDKGNIEARKQIDVLKKSASEQHKEIKTISENKKNKCKSSNKKIFGLRTNSIVLVLVFGVSIFAYSAISKDEPVEQDKDISESRIEQIKKEYFESKETDKGNEIESKKQNENKQDEVNKLEDTKPELGNEQNQYIKSMELYDNGKYEQSAPIFAMIADNGKEERFVSESTFFAALSYEKWGDTGMALSYYEQYAENYEGQHYYDDALYSMGLILYEKGEIEKSIKTMKKLKAEVPDSIYVNSKLEKIISIQN